MPSALSLLGLAVLSASAVSAHTTFTTLLIDGKNQGDGTCVRMSNDPGSSSNPIESLDSPSMACGVDGETPVKFTCPASAGSTLTFISRMWADGSHSGFIDPSHMGPCAVYMKRVGDMGSSEAAGSGWFKIWDMGYNPESDKWCTETLIENNGMLSVSLPTGIPSGNYLIRPEILALQSAMQNDPQFYTGCAQVYVSGSKPDSASLDIPDGLEVSIPGFVSYGEPSVFFDPYKPRPYKQSYEIPGPKVFFPTSFDTRLSLALNQDDGPDLIPEDCAGVNANWCGVEIPSFHDQGGCWDSASNCWEQVEECYKEAPPSGNKGCQEWETMCSDLNDQCLSGNYDGSQTGEFSYMERVNVPLPGPIPPPMNGGSAKN